MLDIIENIKQESICSLKVDVLASLASIEGKWLDKNTANIIKVAKKGLAITTTHQVLLINELMSRHLMLILKRTF